MLAAVSGGLVGMLTWYDILGVLPGAPPGQVQSAYQERARLLDPRMLDGAPSKVLKAADAARAAVSEAWHVLQNAAARQRYDEQIGVRQNREGPGSALSTPSGAGGAPPGGYVTADMVMAGLADLMTSHPSPPRRVIVPDLRGLFMRSCLRAAGDLGLHLEMSQLTEHPMPVEGLVVDQSPLPGSKVRRSSTLTVEIWHPSSRSERA
jgi:curved DNA-binding protein CbpA